MRIEVSGPISQKKLKGLSGITFKVFCGLSIYLNYLNYMHPCIAVIFAKSIIGC